MSDRLHSWIGLGVGIAIMGSGLRYFLKPKAFVGIGFIPATDPRTVRAFGIFFFVLGLLNAGLNLTKLLSE